VLNAGKASVCDNFMERVQHNSLDLLQFISKLAEYPGIDKMKI
jgi:hypothetical protein